MVIAHGIMNMSRPLVVSTSSEFYIDIDPISGQGNNGATVTFSVHVSNIVLTVFRPLGTVSIKNLYNGSIIVSGSLSATENLAISSATLITNMSGGVYNLVVFYPGYINNNGLSFKASQSDSVPYTINK